ncbi:MAG: 30S ribosomal protein S12 methylthiotransferase RimO [Clostridia bacterium]|nr:30S ribosomal protein S12 methylthiotransferase RimO [Clostridia bacterium]
MSYTVGAVSLGCSKNRVDTETALGLLSSRGYRMVSDPAQADILLVNTCGFIGPAKEESINTILEMAEYKNTGKCRLLVVTGCLAQRYEEELMKELPEIDLLLGVNQYASLPDRIEQALSGTRVHACQDDLSYFEQERLLTTPFYSAYVRIGEGCSNRCTFCAIPLIRGPYRSRGEAEILKEVRLLAERGVREHILIAQDTTRWGTDRGDHSQLPALMRKIAAVPGVDWLRVLYCYPDETSEELLDLLADTPNICPYLDIPIQHINSDILKRMHRLGTREDVLRCVRGAKERGLTVRTTLMTGFPGETEDQFQELLDFVQEARFDRLGAFAYSPEEGTAAARMKDQIPEEVKQERLDRLMTLQQSISMDLNRKRVGTEEKVLVTDVSPDGRALGRSRRETPETDGEIVFAWKKAMPEIGSFTSVRITGAQSYDLTGEMI